MPKKNALFPDPRHFSSIDGVVRIGGNLNTKTLLQAYSLGIFPWPVEGYPLLWHCPEERGILDFQKFHISRSLKHFLQKHPYRLTFNNAFPQVIEGCARQKRKGQVGTWITSELITAYTKLHRLGHAHSVECWEDKKLIAGLYGIYINGLFSGESMFGLKPNTSKLCLVALVDRLKSLGHSWMDIQMVTPVTKAFGGEYISRASFLDRKDRLRKKPLKL